jgi:hypothetical protein
LARSTVYHLQLMPGLLREWMRAATSIFRYFNDLGTT